MDSQFLSRLLWNVRQLLIYNCGLLKLKNAFRRLRNYLHLLSHELFLGFHERNPLGNSVSIFLEEKVLTGSHKFGLISLPKILSV